MSNPEDLPRGVVGSAELLRLSKEVSRVLRHRPDSAGVVLDRNGWVSIDALIAGLAARGVHLSRSKLDVIVSTSDKQRFAISDDGRSIRANQGHSVGGVDLQLRQKTPPSRLFHGTIAVNVESIERTGLRPMKRTHVHLSPDRATAIVVGGRRGAAVVFEIDAHRMHSDGIKFLQSVNGVWLVHSVAPRYLTKCS